MEKPFDPEKELDAARSRFCFWMDRQRVATSIARIYFRSRADYWLAKVDELEAKLLYGPNPG